MMNRPDWFHRGSTRI